MTPIAVVMINHNGGEEIVSCLEDLAAQAPAEIVVVDNASTDGSPAVITERFPLVRMVRNEENRGFAAAANQGIAATSAPYVFLVNPDTSIAPGSLDALAGLLDEQRKAALVGALVRNPDGSPQPTKRAFPSLWNSILHGLLGIFWTNNPGTRAYLLTDADLSKPRRVDWVAGTAVAIRRTAFEDLGGFDERFFFFVEDVDLCKRASDAGYEIWFQPAAVVDHEWGSSWRKRPLRFLWMHQANLFRYVLKHRKGAWVLLYPVIAAGLAARFLLLAFRWLITKRSVPGHRSIGGRV